MTAVDKPREFWEAKAAAEGDAVVGAVGGGGPMVAACVVHKVRHRGGEAEESWYACWPVRETREEAERDLAEMLELEPLREVARRAVALEQRLHHDAAPDAAAVLPPSARAAMRRLSASIDALLGLDLRL